MKERARHIITHPGFAIILIVLVAVLVAFFAANFVINNSNLRGAITALGYPGIILMAAIASFNVITVPAASLVPIFAAAGLKLPFIIIALAIGTFISDCINIVLGIWSGEIAASKYPATYHRFKKLYDSHSTLLWPMVFIYVAFIPLSNQVIILPLAALGMSLRTMLLVLMLGALVNQGVLALSAQSLFVWFTS